jgi:hypothetical protein
LAADAKALRDLVILSLQNGSHVVVVAHSWAAMPMSGALEGLDKESRVKEGKTTWISRLIYCAAFVALPGSSIYNAVGNQLHPLWNIQVSGVLFPL